MGMRGWGVEQASLKRSNFTNASQYSPTSALGPRVHHESNLMSLENSQRQCQPQSRFLTGDQRKAHHTK